MPTHCYYQAYRRSNIFVVKETVYKIHGPIGGQIQSEQLKQSSIVNQSINFVIKENFNMKEQFKVSPEVHLKTIEDTR